MTIKIYAIGKIKDFYKSGCDEYLKRISGYSKIEVIELKDESVSDKPSISEITKVKDIEQLLKLSDEALVPIYCYIKDEPVQEAYFIVNKYEKTYIFILK